jgi:hypothetical protein
MKETNNTIRRTLNQVVESAQSKCGLLDLVVDTDDEVQKSGLALGCHFWKDHLPPHESNSTTP